MDGLHFFTFTLQLLVFFIHSLFLTLVTLTTTAAVDTTPKKHQEDANHGRHHNDENVPGYSTLTVKPFSARAISRNNFRPARIIGTLFSRITPVTFGMPGAIAARFVETLTIDFLSY